MTSFSDFIKNSVLESFSSTISIQQIILSLLCALVASLIIMFIYKLTNDAPVVNRMFLLTILMTALVSAMIVTTITSNLALSLGMVGALSIVRFRTAIKNTIDTVFMFWAVAAGITAGAQAYYLCLFACLIIALIVYIFSIITKAGAAAYVLVVRCDNEEAMTTVKKTIDKFFKKATVSSSNRSALGIECVWEICGTNLEDKAAALSEIEGVQEISLTACASTAI